MPDKNTNIDDLFIPTPEVVREPSENEFDPVVKRLREHLDNGIKLSYPLTGKPDDIARLYRRFGDAAKRNDRSPRRVEVKEDAEAGTITYVVTLRPAIIKGSKDAAESVEDTETAE